MRFSQVGSSEIMEVKHKGPEQEVGSKAAKRWQETWQQVAAGQTMTTPSAQTHSNYLAVNHKVGQKILVSS